MNEHHLGAVSEDQVSDSTVGQCDAHQVLTLQRQNLQEQKHLSISIILTEDTQYAAVKGEMCKIWPGIKHCTFKDNINSPSHVHPGSMELPSGNYLGCTSSETQIDRSQISTVHGPNIHGPRSCLPCCEKALGR